MFDGEAFGQQMVEIVRGYLASEIEPVLAENKALTERVAQLEAREIPEAINGEPGKDGEPGRDGIDGTPGADGQDGIGIDDIEVLQDGAAIELAFTRGDTRDEFAFELPAGPSGAPGERGEKGERGADGKLPIVKAWVDGVHYEGEVRSHAGATWQATRDTGHAPPHEDWACIAERGGDGAAGLGFTPRGLWTEAETYQRNDVVALNASSFVALSDDPGVCPGDGWRLIAGQGKRGPQGERGLRGEQGPAGPPVIALSVDDEGVLTLTNADGSTVECDLYPLLSKLGGANG